MAIRKHNYVKLHHLDPMVDCPSDFGDNETLMGVIYDIMFVKLLWPSEAFAWKAR